MDAVDIFIAYSHNDLRFKDELKKFLRPLLNTAQARIWDDYDIEAGKDWESEIKTRLYGADIILLLVSPDSLASDYFYGREVAVSLERHEKGEAVVVPVILRPCAWTITPLRRIEAMPEKGKPIALWASQDEAFTDIAHRIGDIVERLAAERLARTQQEAAARKYQAVVATADHLFDRSKWAEARQEYSNALTLHQTGFVPEATALRRRIETCEQNIADIAEQKDVEKRRAAWKKTLLQAENLYSQEKWAEALALFRETNRQYDPVFSANEDNQRTHERISSIELSLRQATESQNREQKIEVQFRQYIADAERQVSRHNWVKAAASAEKALALRPGNEEATRLLTEIENARPTSSSSPRQLTAPPARRILIYGLVLAAILLTALGVWRRPWKNLAKWIEKSNMNTEVNNSKSNQSFQPSKPANTLPALRQFLKMYPNDQNTVETQKQLDSLEKQYTVWLAIVDLNIEDRDYNTARRYLKKILAIDPNNEDILNKMEKIKDK